MPKTRDSYRVVGQTAAELSRELNFLLQRIADRLDKLEGIRGGAETAGGLGVTGGPVYVDDTDGTRIHSMEGA